MIFPGNPENRFLGFPLSLCSTPGFSRSNFVSLSYFYPLSIPCPYPAPGPCRCWPDVYRILEISLRTRDGREKIPDKIAADHRVPLALFHETTSKSHRELATGWVSTLSNIPQILGSVSGPILLTARGRKFSSNAGSAGRNFSRLRTLESQVGNKVSDEVEYQRAGRIDGKKHFKLLSFREHRWI